MKTGFYRDSGEIKPEALGALMADITCSKVFKNWDKDLEIAEKVKAIKVCKENARYSGTFESLLRDVPANMETAKAFTELIKRLKKFERPYLTDHSVRCI
jgi:hypothetical protein